MLEFVYSIKDLFEQSQKCEKENLDSQYKILLTEGKFCIDKTFLVKHNNQHHKMLEK